MSTPCGEAETSVMHYRVAEAIMDRYKGGETIASLAWDYMQPVWMWSVLCVGRRTSPVINTYVQPALIMAELKRLEAPK